MILGDLSLPGHRALTSGTPCRPEEQGGTPPRLYLSSKLTQHTASRVRVLRPQGTQKGGKSESESPEDKLRIIFDS